MARPKTNNAEANRGVSEMVISEKKMKHMHGVAEYMYKHASEFNLQNRDEMYLLGLLHDIGYMYGQLNHSDTGSELIGKDSYYGKFIFAHDKTPEWCMKKYSCTKSEIPNELKLLWTADMMIGPDGDEIGFSARLDDIEIRYGKNSNAFKVAGAIISFLRNEKAIEFLTGDFKDE